MDFSFQNKIAFIVAEKSFHNKKILKGISCSFKKGETSLIIGQTGAGKTVFLKCLLGLHDYDNGKIIFDNIELNKILFLRKFITNKRLLININSDLENVGLGRGLK